MEIEVFDAKTSMPAGKVEIPDDVLEAAAKVYAWLRQHNAIKLHGLCLADD